MATPTDDRGLSAFVLGLAVYFAVFGLTRLLIADSLELDEAEQVLLSQWWQWGYSAQPPLYTWLQAGFNTLFGVNLRSQVLLRELLLFLTLLAVYASARRVLGRRDLAIAAALALLLLPQFVWENQREHTHSLLVLALAAATLERVLALFERQRLRDYLLLGLLCALGLLAKYNFALFAAGLALAMLSLPAGRRLLWDGRALAGALLGLLLLLPHGLWVLDQQTVAAAVVGKVHAAHADLSAWSALGRVPLTLLTFFTPLWLVFLLLFPGVPRGRRHPDSTAVLVTLLGRYVLIACGLLLATVWLLEANLIKERWLQPLFFPVPILLLAYLPLAYTAESQARRRLGIFMAVAIGAASLAWAIGAARLPLAPLTGGYSRLHWPAAELARQVRDAGWHADATLIAADYHLAGVLRLHLRGGEFYGPRADFVIPRLQEPGRTWFLVWDAGRQAEPPATLRAWAQGASLSLDGRTPEYSEHPLHHGAGRVYRLGLLVLGGSDFEPRP